MARQRVWHLSAMVSSLHVLSEGSCESETDLLNSRLDLRPRREDGSIDESSDGESLAPPLGSDGQDSDSGSQRRRASRLLDLGRLRHASAEERILALRQYRTEQRARNQHRGSDDDTETTTSVTDPDTGRRRVKLSDRLRDKFRIRTTPQADMDTRGGT